MRNLSLEERRQLVEALAAPRPVVTHRANFDDYYERASVYVKLGASHDRNRSWTGSLYFKQKPEDTDL